MSDLKNVVFTPEAAAEFRELPSDRKAWVTEKIRHVRRVGWAEALRLKLVKKLKNGGGAHEIIVKGSGASYRLLCFPMPGKEGRLVVTTTCSSKGDLLGRRLKNQLVQARNRLDKWVSQHGELLR